MPARPSVKRPRYFFFGLRQVPPRAERVGDLEADVVARAGVPAARDCRARRRASRRARTRRARAQAGAYSLGGLVAPEASSASRRPQPRLALADDAGLLLDLLGLVLGLDVDVGGEGVATTVSSRSSSERHAAGRRDRGERERVVDLHLDASSDDRLGDLVRQRLDVDLAGDLVEHAALDDAGGVVGAGAARRTTVAWIATSRRTRSRSMCIVSPRTGWCCGVLEDGRRGSSPSIARSRTAPRAGERDAQLARVDGEGDRLLAAAVEDAGHLAGAAQAARRARATGGVARGQRRVVCPDVVAIVGAERVAPPAWARYVLGTGRSAASAVYQRFTSNHAASSDRRRSEQALLVQRRRPAAGCRRPSPGARGTPCSAQ